MGYESNKPGLANTSEYLPTPFLLGHKHLAKNNILIGSDPAQIRFFEDFAGHETTLVERITDESLLGKSGLLLRVHAAHQMDLSPDVKEKTGIWSADAITAGSAGANALVRQAANRPPPQRGGSLLPRDPPC